MRIVLQITIVVLTIVLTQITGKAFDRVNNSYMGDYTEARMQEDTTTISGRLFVGGHEPFTVLALEKDDGTAVVLSGEEKLYRELWSYQNKTLKCRGMFTSDPLHGETFYVVEFHKIK